MTEAKSFRGPRLQAPEQTWWGAPPPPSWELGAPGLPDRWAAGQIPAGAVLPGGRQATAGWNLGRNTCTTEAKSFTGPRFSALGQTWWGTSPHIKSTVQAPGPPYWCAPEGASPGAVVRVGTQQRQEAGRHTCIKLADLDQPPSSGTCSSGTDAW